MRKLIVSYIASLDGYFEGPSRDIMVLPMDHAFDAYNAERLEAADTLLLGARTYGLLKGFWPQMLDNPAATPDHLRIAHRNNAIQKLVVSDSMQAEETAPWQETTRVVRRKAAHRELAELKRGPGRDILMFGSQTLYNDLLQVGLVDELHVMLGAVVLGEGTPAIARSGLALQLLDTRRWEGSSNVLLRYAVKR